MDGRGVPLSLIVTGANEHDVTQLDPVLAAIMVKRKTPSARRWVVEVCHSWFNRLRKLLVRYEKLERSFVALNHIAAAIIALRKVPLSINIIYG